MDVIELDDDGWQVIPPEIIGSGDAQKQSDPIQNPEKSSRPSPLHDDLFRHPKLKDPTKKIKIDENGWQVFPQSSPVTESNEKESKNTADVANAMASPSKDLWPIFRPKETRLLELPKSSNGAIGVSAITNRREFWKTPAPNLASPAATTSSFPKPVSRPVPLPQSPSSRALATLDPYQYQQPKPTSVVDPAWELIDPNPDVHALFLIFNATYFWDKLGIVTVEWSSKMTSCAGICYYKRIGRLSEIRIKLSLPLLKLRPRKDLVETLLHEMIHAYLFLEPGKGASHDRDGHGPNFQEHMHRINRASGSNITIYHSFHDEVGHYQQHWWQCNGPCRHRQPYYGLVKRAMNRPPGPSDRWWSEHASGCDGVFIKVKEPAKTENEQGKKLKRPASSTATS